MVIKGNHPQMALIQWLVKYYNLPIYIYIYIHMCVYGIYGIPPEFPGLLQGSDLLRTSGTFWDVLTEAAWTCPVEGGTRSGSLGRPVDC
jgi:hypothetical protein